MVSNRQNKGQLLHISAKPQISINWTFLYIASLRLFMLNFLISVLSQHCGYALQKTTCFGLGMPFLVTEVTDGDVLTSCDKLPILKLKQTGRNFPGVLTNTHCCESGLYLIQLHG